MHGDEEAAPPLEDAFVDGFRAAGDRRAFLTLTGIPDTLVGHGEPSLHLVEVRIEDRFEVGWLGHGFASTEAVHQPLPGKMIQQRHRVVFVYAGTGERRELSLAEIRAATTPAPGGG